MRIHYHHDADSSDQDRPMCPQLSSHGMGDSAPRPLSACLSCTHSSHGFCSHTTEFATSGDISPFGMW